MDTSRRVVPVAVAVVVIAGAILTLVGGLVAGLRPGLLLPPGTALTRGVDLYAARMAARNLALGVAVVGLLVARAVRPLAAVLGVVVLVEIGDTVSAVAAGSWAEGAGAVAVAVACGWAARRLLRVPG